MYIIQKKNPNAMIKYLFFFLLMLHFTVVNGQELTGPELLKKAIQHHDPMGAWESFQGKLSITMKTPKSSDRISDIVLDLPGQYFKLTAKKDENIIEQTLDKDACELVLNGDSSISAEDSKTHRLTCERAVTMKNYYTYLYGLPMKLTDPGTIINPKVQRRSFKNKEYLVLSITYDETVGKDAWYFYFDPETYAMKVYQFYHDESKNDGEYILLEGEEKVHGIKMPKTRAWYNNKNDEYLGTDILTKVSSI